VKKPVTEPEQEDPDQQIDWQDAVQWNEQGLVPAIARDARSGAVLMLAWMNRAALEETVRSGYAVYWSRSRGRLWRKGETSGHRQRVREIRLDCDGDTLLLSVEQEGGVACHTGRRHCFYRRLEVDGERPVWRVVEAVIVDPAELYGGGRDPQAADRKPEKRGAEKGDD